MADKAGKDYWEKNWEKRAAPCLIDHQDISLNCYVNTQFCKIFDTVFSGCENLKKIKVLEVGCANSIWLPYFKKRYDCEIFGIDYSEKGVELEKQILKYCFTDGQILLADMFNPPDELLNAFDIVFSFGVIEHFDDTSKVICHLKKFLKNNGVLITVIPNMQGITGVLQSSLNRNTFLKHIVLNKNDLHKAHKDNGFIIRYCDYFLPINLSVVNIDNLIGTMRHKLISKTRSMISKSVWILDRTIIKIKPNKITSPYLVVIANKG